MNIFSNTSIINILNKMLNPLVNILFTRKERKNFIKEDYENIVMNIVSNIIGLGNAATAIGLKEMSILDERKEEKAMKKFVLLNSASIQLFPLSIIGIRIMNNSSNPYIVVIPILISSFIALFLGMISLNILNRFSL